MTNLNPNITSSIDNLNKLINKINNQNEDIVNLERKEINKINSIKPKIDERR